jgi:serine/threonine protein kinase/tetratricopeptide (TPR) repeat protein
MLLELNVSWSDVTLDTPCVEAVEQLLLKNCTIASLPLERLLVAAPPRLRCRLSDATKVNIGLRSSSSRLLLPWHLRKAFRLFAGHPTPAEAVNPDPADVEASDLVLDAVRLSPFDTWVEVGRGAFSCVYRAALDGGDVCVKVITRGAADDDGDDDNCDDRGLAFSREFALMHELGAESQARRRCVYARYVCLPPGSTNTIWLVFDLMEQGSLGQAVALLTPSQRLQALADVSRAVADLHEADVLHRDLAVRNVLLNSFFRAYLCDFGLSCRSAYPWECPAIPTYDWPPEMFTFDGATYTQAADVWSFGIVMLSTLCGRNPLRKLTRDIVKAMHRAWATAASQPVPELEGTRHAAAQISDLESENNYESRITSSRVNYRSIYRPSREAQAEVGPPHDPMQWWDEHMALPGGMTTRDRALRLLAHACCRWNPVERPRMALVTELLAHLAAAASQPKEDVLVQSAGEVLLLVQWWLLGERVALTWRPAGNVRFVATPAQAVALAALVPRLRAELASAEAAGDANAAAVGPCLSRLAVLLDAQGTTAEAASLHARILALAEAAGAESAEVAYSLLAAGRRLLDQGDYTGAVLMSRRALTMSEAVHGPGHHEVARSLSCLGIALLRQNETAAAVPVLKRSLAITELVLGTDHPDVATGLNNLAGALQASHDVASAVPLYRRALTIREASLGPQHPEVATSLNNLACALQIQGDVVVALPLLRRALMINEATLPSQDPKLASSLNSLAAALEAPGQDDDVAAALRLYQRALSIREAYFGPLHPDTLAVRANVLRLSNTQCVVNAFLQGPIVDDDNYR